MTGRIRRSRHRAVLAVVALAFAVPACAITGTGPKITDDEDLGERIVDPFDLAAEEILALPGTPGGEVADALDAAVAARDTCALLFALDLDLPDADDRDGAIEAYDALLAAVTAAESFIAQDLEVWWPTLLDAATRGADAVQRADGDLTHPGIAPIFTSAETQEAVAGIGRYRDESCEEPAADAATETTTTTAGS